MSDDITFCGNECDNTKCRRHRSNIREPQYPHSFAYLEGTEYCEKKSTSVRLINADKIYPDCMTKDGKLAISQSQLANAPTVDAIVNTIEVRPHGKWNIIKQDNEGVHKIECPFCQYSKGSDFSSIVTVIFDRFPPFCENCGAQMQGGVE